MDVTVSAGQKAVIIAGLLLIIDNDRPHSGLHDGISAIF